MEIKLAKNKPRGEYSAVLQALLGRPSNPKLGLSRIGELLHKVGFKPRQMRIIQVVGTNGKGSTVAFIESILHQHGIKTGLFTSPHLCTARERIRIEQEMLSCAEFVDAASVVLAKAKELSDEASFFECLLAMAMWIFQEKNVSVVILETGLGGRLDATTALKADVLGVSMIDFDHQNILGSSLQEIASEKIYAAYRGQSVVIAPQRHEVLEAIDEAEKILGFKKLPSSLCHKPLGLFGAHQQANAGLALDVVKALGLAVSEELTEEALQKTRWPGRFEIISQAPTVVLDGAHNPSGISALMESLKSHPLTKGRPLLLVYGSLTGPNAEKKIELLAQSGLDIRRVFLHRPNNPRALDEAQMTGLFAAQGLKTLALGAWSELQDEAQSLKAAIVVCGSLYTVGQLRGELLGLDFDPMLPNY